jgi:hypothetical protein
VGKFSCKVMPEKYSIVVGLLAEKQSFLQTELILPGKPHFCSH